MVELSRTRDEIIRKADELAAEYESKYRGCGQCTFLAVVDALRWGGLEIIPEDMEDRLFSGVCLLTGGTAVSGDGTCGAVASSVLAIGMALGIPRDSQDVSAVRAGCAAARNGILDKYYGQYGSLLCKDVQRRRYGKAWDLTSDEMAHEFLGLSGGCTIMQTAVWATECILDQLEQGNLRGRY